MDLLDVMRCAPSTRRFGEEPVSLEVVRRALDVARFAPSGGNRQPWRIVVVDDADKRRAMRDLYVPNWEAYIESLGATAVLHDPPPEGVPPGRVRGLRDADDFARNLDQAPVHIVAFVEPSLLAITDSELERPSIVGGASIYPFVQNLLLALRGEGLGAAFTTLLAPAEGEVRELLSVPQELALAGHIAVGHRADPWPRQLRRNPVEAFASYNSFGAALPD